MIGLAGDRDLAGLGMKMGRSCQRHNGGFPFFCEGGCEAVLRKSVKGEARVPGVLRAEQFLAAALYHEQRTLQSIRSQPAVAVLSLAASPRGPQVGRNDGGGCRVPGVRGLIDDFAQPGDGRTCCKPTMIIGLLRLCTSAGRVLCTVAGDSLVLPLSRAPAPAILYRAFPNASLLKA